MLGAIGDYLAPIRCLSYALQLGDWFDIWRVCGSDRPMSTTATSRMPASTRTSSRSTPASGCRTSSATTTQALRSLPDRRAGQPIISASDSGSVATSTRCTVTKPISRRPRLSWDQLAVHIATLVAAIAPRVTTLEQYIDRLGDGPGVARWLRDSVLAFAKILRSSIALRTMVRRRQRSLRILRRTRERRCVREHRRQGWGAAAIAGRAADVVIVGHSHAPCVAWTEVTGRPIVVVDAGSCVYGRANLLLMAGTPSRCSMSSDRGAVRAVVRRIALHALAIAAFFAMGCARALPYARFTSCRIPARAFLATTNETYARIAVSRTHSSWPARGTKSSRRILSPVVEGRSFDLLPELALRSQALTVLVHYFDVLEAFATNDAAGVDEAALELGASVSKLDGCGRHGEHAKEVSGILATGIDVIGKEIAAGQRASALERVMARRKKDVETPRGARRAESRQARARDRRHDRSDRDSRSRVASVRRVRLKIRRAERCGGGRDHVGASHDLTIMTSIARSSLA